MKEACVVYVIATRLKALFQVIYCMQLLNYGNHYWRSKLIPIRQNEENQLCLQGIMNKEYYALGGAAPEPTARFSKHTLDALV